MSQITREKYETALEVLEQVSENASKRNNAAISDVSYMVKIHREENR